MPIRRLIVENRPVRVARRGKPAWYLVTDAATKGAGGVLMSAGDGTVRTWSRDWSDAERARPIHEREMQAAVEAARFFGEFLVGAEVAVYIDNTSGLYAARNRRAVSFELNALIGEFERATRECASITLRYIASEDNVADPLSRGKLVLPGQVKSFGDAVKRVPTEGFYWVRAGVLGESQRNTASAHQRTHSHVRLVKRDAA